MTHESRQRLVRSNPAHTVGHMVSLVRGQKKTRGSTVRVRTGLSRVAVSLFRRFSIRLAAMRAFVSCGVRAAGDAEERLQDEHPRNVSVTSRCPRRRSMTYAVRSAMLLYGGCIFFPTPLREDDAGHVLARRSFAPVTASRRRTHRRRTSPTSPVHVRTTVVRRRVSHAHRFGNRCRDLGGHVTIHALISDCDILAP